MAVELEWVRDADGVAVVLLPGGPFGPDELQALEQRVDALLGDASVPGIVLASGARGFLGEFAPAWLHARQQDAGGALAAFAQKAESLASRIAAAGKPVAAAIERDAHGAGLELALACHKRIGAEGAAYTVGFTHARWGLAPLMATLPRLAALIGAGPAGKLLAEGTALTPAAALKARLFDELVPAGSAAAAAARWVILEASRRAQRPAEAAMARMGANLAQTVDTHAASDAFVRVARGSVAQDMTRTLGLSVAAANRLESRPQGIPIRSFAKVGVLGAGLMGSGIALVCARAGMQVAMVDTSLEAAQRGHAALARQEASGVAAGRLDAAESRETLSRIVPTSRYEDLDGVDIVVEAVFEDREVKANATKRAEAAAGPGALFATNTSTLPITGLALASARPRRFIGLHFFSPVPRMPLLEIIRGRETDDETLAHAMDFARAIGKTPIVVNDARGFYTTRVVMAYQAEAFDMLAQGCDPEIVEAGGMASGMPVPPLALSDAVALDLIHQINLQAARDLGDAYAFTPGYELVGRMVEAEGRKGKKTSAGFYDYAAEGGGKSLWPGLRAFASAGRAMPLTVADARDRLLAAQALETVRCLEEGVITDPSQCDVGAILGWGFAPWTGGPLSWIDRQGVAACVSRCQALSDRYASPRLAPTPALKRLASEGGSIYATRWPMR